MRSLVDRFVLSPWLLFSTLTTLVSAQSATGFPPFGSFQGGGLDVVNTNNLNVHLAIPLFHKAGRGLPVNFSIEYDSSVWSTTYNSTTNKDQWQFLSGWSMGGASNGVLGRIANPQTTLPGCPTGQHAYSPSYTDPSGTVHAFGSYIYPQGQCGGVNSWNLSCDRRVWIRLCDDEQQRGRI